MALRMASISSAGSDDFLLCDITDEWCAPGLLMPIASMPLLQPCLCTSCVWMLLVRVDAAVDAELDCETAGGSSPDASEVCVSFGGAAAPLRDRSGAALPAETVMDAIDTVAVQQINPSERQAQCSISPPGLATLGSTARTAAREHPKCAGNRPSPTAGGHRPRLLHRTCACCVCACYGERL